MATINFTEIDRVMRRTFAEQVDFWTGQVVLGIGRGEVQNVVKQCMDAVYDNVYNKGFDMGFSLGAQEGRATVQSNISVPPVKSTKRKTKVIARTTSRKTKPSKRAAKRG